MPRSLMRFANSPLSNPNFTKSSTWSFPSGPLASCGRAGWAMAARNRIEMRKRSFIRRLGGSGDRTIRRSGHRVSKDHQARRGYGKQTLRPNAPSFYSARFVEATRLSVPTVCAQLSQQLVRDREGKGAGLQSRSALPFLPRLAIQRFNCVKRGMGRAAVSEKVYDGVAGLTLQADVAVIAGTHEGGVKAGKRVTKESVGNTIQRFIQPRLAMGGLPSAQPVEGSLAFLARHVHQ